MTDWADFAGKTAIVTGAGDGIGEMLAKQLAGVGMQVGVLDIRPDAAARVAGEIGPDAFVLCADVSDRDAMLAAASTVRGRGNGVSFLWINAGAGVGANLIDTRPSVIEWAFGVNVLGTIWTAQAFVPLMKETMGARHLGFTASTASLRDPDMPLTVYGVTKQGAFAVAEGLRNEVAEMGIATTILCPGLLNTDIWDGARARPERFGGERRADPEIAARWRAAKSPEVMWPHIQRVVADGGGYLVCNTEGGMLGTFKERSQRIGEAFVDV
ncbi:MAG: SDR family NAD(P)-dependent oxidoreductase [Pseudomonadota bacterium]